MKKDFELFKYDVLKKSLTMHIKVKAGAKKNSIGQWILYNNLSYLKISIKEIPEGGKANIAIISYFSDLLKIAKSNIEIIQGKTNSYKTLKINDIEIEILKKYHLIH